VINIAEDSFLDWERNLKNGKTLEKDNIHEIRITKIGLPEDQFKKFVQQWKKKHFKKEV